MNFIKLADSLTFSQHLIFVTEMCCQVVSSSTSESSPPISQSDLTSVTPVLNDRSQTADTNVKVQTDVHPSEQ